MKIKKASLKPQIGSKTWKSNIKFFLIIFLLFFGVAIFLIFSISNLYLKSPESYHLACPYSIEDYKPKAASSTSSQKVQAKAVIVSHHLLAKDLIIDTFDRLETNYETVILVGPNHANLGLQPIQITDYPFKTKFGNLEPNQKIINKLVKNEIASIERENFNNEHSICSLVSFVKIYFPKAKIVPIILKGNTPLEKTQKLASFLAQECGQKCLIIASLDFSHDVLSQQAQINDQKSSQILKNLEEENLEQVVCDSMPTLQVLVNFLKHKEAANGEIIHQANSNQLSGQNLSTVTSYLFMIF